MGNSRYLIKCQDGQFLGPYEPSKLRELVSAGNLPEGALVQRVGSTKWRTPQEALQRIAEAELQMRQQQEAASARLASQQEAREAERRAAAARESRPSTAETTPEAGSGGRHKLVVVGMAAALVVGGILAGVMYFGDRAEDGGDVDDSPGTERTAGGGSSNAEKGPSASEALVSQAIAAASAGQHDAAERLYRQLIATDPVNADHRLGLARAQLARRNVPMALRTLQEVLAASPDHAESWVAMADAQEASGDVSQQLHALDRAAQCFGAASAVESDAARRAALAGRRQGVLESALVAASEAGRYDQALAYARELLTVTPVHQRSLEELAWDADARGATQERDAYVARMQSETADSLRLRAIGPKERKEWAAAAGLLERALSLEPGSAEAWLELAIVKWLADLDLDALAAVRKAVDLDPGNAEYRLWQARILRDLGRGSEALTACDAASERGAAPSEVDGLRGQVLVNLERYAEAEPLLKRSIAVELDMFSVWALADCLTELGRPLEAAQACAVMESLDTDDAHKWRSRMHYWLAAHHNDAAAGEFNMPEWGHLKFAIEADPENLDARNHYVSRTEALIDLLLRAGKRDEIAQLLVELDKYDPAAAARVRASLSGGRQP